MSLPVWFGMAGAAIFFAWIFPAIGLVLLFVATRESLRAQRYGRSTFVMHSVPGVLGGHLRGDVHVATSIGAARDLTARLFCHWPVSKARPAHSWQEELPVERARALAGVTGSVLPVAFTIPYGLPASDKHGEVVWYLEVAGQAVGVDYFARFEVPVQRLAVSLELISRNARDELCPVSEARIL